MKRSLMLLLVLLLLSGFTEGGENTVIDDIKVLNLLNGLELEKEQAKFILEKAKAAQEVRKEKEEKVSEKYSQHSEVYQELKDALIKGGELTEDFKERVHKAQNEINEMEDSYDERLKNISLEVKDRLQSFQAYALESYKPCLIPPKGELRVGQVDTTEGLEKILEKIREAPSHIYEKRRDRIAEDMIEKAKQRLPKGFTMDEEAEKGRIVSVLEEARALSDVDFAIKKKELAEKLKSKYALPKLPVDVWTKVDRFLFAPEAIPLLEVFISTRWK